MTVEAQNPDGTPIVKSGPYNGNGVTTAFNYTFPITAIGEVKVVRQNADLTETVLVLTTDYSVTGAGNPAGGQVILNSGALLPTGAKLVLLLDMDFDQAVDYSNQGRIQLSLLEISLDKLTLAARQLREELLRAVTVDAFGTVDTAQLRANINALAAIEAQMITVSNNIASVQSNAAGIASINTNAANIVAIQNASANADSAASSAAAAAASAASADFKNFGYGITGNAPLLANLDTAGLASGIYRFDGTTLGTFPAGIAAADTGIVILDRMDADDERMTLFHATSEVMHSRRRVAGALQSWVVRGSGLASQALAEAGADNASFMSSLRTKQQIDARLATQAEAEAGAANTKLMTPLRVREATRVNRTPTSTLTGASVEWLNIPAEVQRIVIPISKASFSGADFPLVQLGTAGGWVTTGYICFRLGDAGGSSAGGNAVTNGIGLDANGATTAQTGVVILERIARGSNLWIAAYNGVRITLPSSANAHASSAGEIDLGGELTRVRLVSSGGGAFDGGLASLSWEF